MFPFIISRWCIGGCISLLLLMFTVAGKSQTVPCNSANAQVTETSGICIGCYVDNPGLAVDNNPVTFSTLHVILGLLGGYTQQQLIFPAKSNAGDSVKIFLTTPVGLLDLNILGNVEVATYNGMVYNNDRKPINNELLHLQLISSQQFLLSWAPSRPFDKVEIRLNSGVLQLLNAINIGYAHLEVPKPLAISPLVKVCNGKPASLGVTGPAGVMYDWYRQSVGGIPVFTGADYTTRPVKGDSSYYVQAKRGDCPNPERTLIKVTALPLPGRPLVSEPVDSICKGTPAAFIASSVPNITHYWFGVSMGGVPLLAADTFITTPLGTNTAFYVEARETTGCVSSSRAAVMASILPPGPGVSMGAPRTWGGTGGDKFTAIINSPYSSDKGFLVAGVTASNDGDLSGQNHGLLDWWLVKLDSANNRKWSRTIGTAGVDSLHGIVATADKKFVVCGVFNLQTNPVGQIVGIDGNGNTLWSLQTNLRNHIPATLLNVTKIVVVGTTANAINLMLLNSTGAIIRTVSYPGNYASDKVSVIPLTDGGLLIAGSTSAGSVYGKDVFIARVDSFLNRQWEKVFLTEGDDIMVSIQPAGEGRFIVSNVIQDNLLQHAAARVMKLSEDGILKFLKVFKVGTLSASGYKDMDHSRFSPKRGGLIDVNVSNVLNCNNVNVLSKDERAACESSCRKGGCRVSKYPDLSSVSSEKRTLPVRAQHTTLAIQLPEGGADGKLYLVELDSIGNVVAIQADTTQVFAPAATTYIPGGGALMVGATSGVSKAKLAKVDPPSCLPDVMPSLPLSALLVQDTLPVISRDNVLATHVDSKEQSSSLIVFPNPFTESLSCRYQVKKAGKIVIRLINMGSGQYTILRTVTATAGMYNLQVNTRHYPAGMYILQLEQAGEKQVSKLIKLN
ncbi:Ig-like domain-containing protein [Chitinophaga nivalis]|uniref:T9SS type A sorting domain-containing protein n=1 Tax=Chitinophaga nivalis TaxID=2991709 RepID=A0ABT3IWH0_9BACT|nr:T9SS type A sorting domain-containing protein [Chitinophaga nivalis]MCW3462006.1 T9SS type A sorting domain-containing protein [Chitinophaga nivalis]MCW3488303.1 T9SS type A sorting domain-containing protein [Chitinophaga nivalis]